MMKNYLLTIRYNGTTFFGWNLQPNKPTIVGSLTTALQQFYNQEIAIHGSGRTDRGVHAFNQMATVKLTTSLSLKKIHKLWNKYLPQTINLTKIEIVANSFHARYSVKNKTYLYQIKLKKSNCFEYDKYWFVDQLLNVEAMKQAAKLFLGFHDFTSFAFSDKLQQNNQRTLTALIINKKDNLLTIKISGDGFLRHMVRKITATLVAVGSGKINQNDIEKMFAVKQARACLYKAPPQGLYLDHVDY